MKVKTHTKNRFKQAWPYFALTFLAAVIFFYGSEYKTKPVASQPIMHSIGSADYVISPDHISEMHIVADLAYSLDLATKNYINMDYISVATQYTINQSGLIKLEKPNVIDTSSLSRGVRDYTVASGESLADIAKRFRVSIDQIRWSNGLRNQTVAVGQKLLIPTIPGIVYTVKIGDTVDSLANRYGTSADKITIHNDLENSNGLAVGAFIIIPSGVPPVNERPENQVIASAPIMPRYSFYRPVSSGNPLPYGWCTWFAWDWRKKNMPWNYHLPSSGLGDAKYWDENLSGRYHMDKTPRIGAVFQDDYGYYGHVGIVIGINADGSIRIADMNGVSGWGRVGEADVPRSKWANWDFIHQARGT